MPETASWQTSCSSSVRSASGVNSIRAMFPVSSLQRSACGTFQWGGVAAQVREATRGAGVDAVFELVGSPATGADSLASLGKGGAVVYVGYGPERIALDPLALVVPEHRVLTSVGNRYAELATAVDLAARGLLRTSVHEVAPLDQLDRVLADLRAGRVVGRAVLEPAS